MARNYFTYIALFLTVLITVGSLIKVPSVGVIEINFSDKIIHIIAYFLLVLSWLLSVCVNGKVKSLWGFIKIAFIVFVYGIVIETMQTVITSTRQADIYDVLANFTGILLALFVFVKILQKKTHEINNILAKVVLKLLN